MSAPAGVMPDESVRLPARRLLPTSAVSAGIEMIPFSDLTSPLMPIGWPSIVPVAAIRLLRSSRIGRARQVDVEIADLAIGHLQKSGRLSHWR